ncbi:hypothetical protein BEWA_011550 [Theileria equi strain WA]|uniref:Uncharacterized protein n=1 Tax=Theileria equi strain WA TaxID=1537102 RepID=L0B1J1_THEEQ|nr:hypothetical protein BEWA_011550 [Theileria equi strain WA]AFZ81737.1 hypothetical protein BEWA_011550 [Theileria equi strain WA]|eukprot:XP_004831403.1 hypothetical protein BEWA_011550 [Theileria equi strain WA]
MPITCEDSGFDTGIVHQVNNIVVDNMPPGLEGQMQDIELNSNDLVLNTHLNFLKSFFDISQGEYKDRCKAALFPYICLNLRCLKWLKDVTSTLNKRIGNRNNNADDMPVETQGGISAESESKDPNATIIDLEITSEEKQNKQEDRSVGAGFYSVNDLSFDSFANNVDKASHIYNTLTSIRDKPDLYGPFWINIFTAGSLFYVNSFHKVFHSAYPVSFVSIGTLMKLTMICFSCTTLMALSMFLCKYHFLRTSDLKGLVGFLGISGYTQIPLAALCKISVWMSLAMVCFPSLKHILYALHLMAYFYLFVSTSCTIFVTLPPLDLSQHDKTFRIASMALSSIIQLVFLAIFQSYTH